MRGDGHASNFEILPGLPAYGPLASPFPTDGWQAFREGLVVQFRRKDGALWVGNFQRGSNSFDAVLAHPNGRCVIVIAGGTGYVTDPESGQQEHTFGHGINLAQHLPRLNVVLVSDGLGFGTFCERGLGWNSDRISWDGFRNIVVDGDVLFGEAYSPMGDRWEKFSLDLLTGQAKGAIYPNEIATAVKTPGGEG